MIVRAAHPTEMAEIGDIRLAAYHADGFLGRESSYATVLHGLGAAGTGRVLVAVDGDRILGTVMLQFWPEAGKVVHGPDEAEIRALAVAPSAQRMGAGRALLQAVIAEAAVSGVRYLTLCTLPEMRTAHRMYERAGFARLPERDWSPQPDSPLLAYGMPLAIPVPGASPVPDAGVPDADVPDAGVPDAEVPDAGVPDGEVPDGSGPDADVPGRGLPGHGEPDSQVPGQVSS